ATGASWRGDCAGTRSTGSSSPAPVLPTRPESSRVASPAPPPASRSSSSPSATSTASCSPPDRGSEGGAGGSHRRAAQQHRLLVGLHARHRGRGAPPADVPDGPRQRLHPRGHAHGAGHVARHGSHRGGGGTCGLRAAAEVRAGAGVPADRCDRAARECAVDRGALARGGPSRARPRHRHHEAGEPRLRDAGNAHRIPRERGIGVVAAVRGARRHRRRLVPLGCDGRHLRAARFDRVVFGSLCRHLHLRRDAGFLVERRHVLHDGCGRRRHAAGGLRAARRDQAAATEPESHAPVPPVGRGFLGVTAALTLAALAWGLVNFGLLLWLPAALIAEGRSVGASSALIARSTLIAAPTIVVCAWLFSAWSTKWSLVAMTGVMVLGMLGLTLQQLGAGEMSHPLIPVALIILGSSGVISMLLPYAAENYPLRIRGRATGWVAACSKLGGLAAQALSVVAGVPPLAAAVTAIAVPAVGSTIL